MRPWHRLLFEEKESKHVCRSYHSATEAAAQKEFPVVFETEILPILRRQKGFLEELLLFTPLKTEMVAISLWEDKEFAEGTPIIRNLEVENATYRKLATVAV